MSPITTLTMDDARDPPSLNPPQKRSKPLKSTSALILSLLPAADSVDMDLQYILSPLVSFPSQPQQVGPDRAERDSRGKVASSQLPIRFEQCSAPLGSVVDGPQVSVRAFKQVHPSPDDNGYNFVDSMVSDVHHLGLLHQKLKTCSFQKPQKGSSQPPTDPYAEDFLKEVLGPHKWEIFSARLFERRLRAKGKGKHKPGGDDTDSKSSVSAIEFLVKVEVVKEILRTYVPHPYNPLKSLSHSYLHAPSGQVTLTRSTILQLSGWSNTQFSYWARRAEALSVLSECDSRLKAVGTALERRLRDNLALSDEGDEEDEVALVTGKGLDAIVDEVKKRTGKSQFLRGKHSSLDPYGTVVPEDDQPQSFVPPPHLFTMTTMQLERYSHTRRITEYRQPSTPPSMLPNPPPASPSSAPKRRHPLLSSQPPPLDLTISQPQKDTSAYGDKHSTDIHKPSDVLTFLSQQNFPISDSRSELENANATGKRKPVGNSKDMLSDSQKRPRTLMSEDES